MILKAFVEEQVYTLNVPDQVVREGSELFDRLDHDMDQGWQMSREWVEHPDRLQRCQIVADKLLTALENGNNRLGMMMAGYILNRLPNVESVELDVQGEMQNNHFLFRDDGEERTDQGGRASADFVPSDRNLPQGLSRMQAMAQAGQDVTKVFKVGKAWRFSVYDHSSGSWHESPLIATEQEAERLRQAAVKERYEQLIGA